MRIHQVIASDQNRHEVDPLRGVIVRKEKVLEPGSALEITDPEHGTFVASPDGTFDVPEELGTFLCSTPGWYEGPNPFGGHEDEPKPKPKPKRARAAA